MKKHYSAALTATCVILGVIIGVQVNTVKQQSLSTENQRLSEVVLALNQMQAERDALLEYLATIDNRKYTVIVNTFHNRTGDPPIPVYIYKEI